MTAEDGKCSQTTSAISVFCRLLVKLTTVEQEELESAMLSLRNTTINMDRLGFNFTTQVGSSLV
jgi:hypothetical protein